MGKISPFCPLFFVSAMPDTFDTPAAPAQPAQATLAHMSELLAQCEQQQCSVPELTRQWRDLAPSLGLPPRYGAVLGAALDRLEASALFSEESCSFSQRDLLQTLHTWRTHAQLHLGPT